MNSPNAQRRRDLAIVLVVSLLIRIGYLLIKPAGVVSDDVHGWQTVANYIAHGRNPYESSYLNYPPFWPGVVWLLSNVGRWSGVGFVQLLWAFLIAVESFLICVTYIALCRFVTSGSARNIALIALALNPAAIFQVTQHGNFDVLVGFLIVMGVVELMKYSTAPGSARRSWLRTCAYLGIGALAKTIPLAVSPLLLSGSRNLTLRRRIIGALLLLAPVTLGIAGIWIASPSTTREFVLGYRSHGQMYGFSGIFEMFRVDAPQRFLATAFLWVAPATLLCLSCVLAIMPAIEPRRIVLLAALILLAIPTLGPGYGSQYIYWYLPLFAIAWAAWDDRGWRRLLLLAWVVTAATYSFEYLFLPTHGALAQALWPHSQRAFAISIAWADRASITRARLPLFAIHLLVLIAGTRLVLRKNVPASPVYGDASTEVR